MDFTLLNLDGTISHKIVTLNDWRTEGMLNLTGGKINPRHFGRMVDVTITAPAQ
jgi:hypothetical protein